jgi:hypothetical protein
MFSLIGLWKFTTQKYQFQLKFLYPKIFITHYPSAGKLRAAYAVNSLSGKTTALDRIIELGNALNRAYPDGDRAPDDFTSLGVGMSKSEMKELEMEPLQKEDILKNPTLCSLIETLQELKSKSPKDMTIDIDLTI